MAAISAVFTIGYVANLLGEDEDWLHDLSIGMEPEDGSLWVYGVGELPPGIREFDAVSASAALAIGSGPAGP